MNPKRFFIHEYKKEAFLTETMYSDKSFIIGRKRQSNDEIYFDLKCMSKSCVFFLLFFSSQRKQQESFVCVSYVYFSTSSFCCRYRCRYRARYTFGCCAFSMCENDSSNVYIYLSANIYKDDDGSRIMKLVCDNMMK